MEDDFQIEQIYLVIDSKAVKEGRKQDCIVKICDNFDDAMKAEGQNYAYEIFSMA